MSVNYKAKMIYDAAVENITKSEDVWKDICRMVGQLYRYEFQNILLIYEQRPGATLVADYDTWKKVDRYVRRGSKGIAVLPSRALQPYIRYVFDIGDTGGKEQSLTWNLEADRKLQFNLLKAFIKRQIRGIIKEDFAERMTQLNMLAGRVITDHDEETPELAVQRLVINSILYAVGTRCGFSLSSEEQDLSLIVNISDVDNIYALGSLVCDVSCTVLRSMNQSITQMERERRKYERTGVLSYGKFGNEHPNLQGNLGRQENGGNYGISNQLSQGRTRDDVPEYRSGAGETLAGKIRNHGNGISGAEPQGTLSDVKNDGYGLHGYDTFHSNGIRLQWRDAEGEKEGYLIWKSVEAEIGALILTGEYYTPHVSMDELLDDDREDIIDGEYREVEEAQQELTDDEIEEILEADRQIADERYEKQQEEGQASASPKSNSPTVADIDFEYIEPADYEKMVAELDEEVREALEILVTSCSIYTHYHPFLQDIVNTEDLLMPNKLDFLTEIVLRGESESRKAYANSPSSLIEYTIKSSSVNLHYCSRSGEKKETEVGSRIVYEILSYMVKQEGYCSKGHRESYERELAETDRTKQNPVYQKFLAKQEEIWERRLIDRQVSRSENPVLERLLLSHYSIQKDISERNELMFRIYDKNEQRLYQDAYGEIPRFRTLEKADYYLHHAIWNRMFPQTGVRYEVCHTSDAFDESYAIYDRETDYYYVSDGTVQTFEREEDAQEFLYSRLLQPEPAVVMEDEILQEEDAPEEAETLKRKEVSQKETPKHGTERKIPQEKAANYRIRTLSTESAGAKTRFQWNVDAIRTLKEIENAGRNATPEEQEILAKYVGWGGISQAFDEANDGWNEEYKQLKGLLTESEYRAARETVTNAFYTPPEVTSAIYAALAKFGFQKGNILEPSAGIGNFFGSLPESMADSRLYGVEKDSISGRIAKQLYPGADIHMH